MFREKNVLDTERINLMKTLRVKL